MGHAVDSHAITASVPPAVARANTGGPPLMAAAGARIARPCRDRRWLGRRYQDSAPDVGASGNVTHERAQTEPDWLKRRHGRAEASGFVAKLAHG